MERKWITKCASNLNSKVFRNWRCVNLVRATLQSWGISRGKALTPNDLWPCSPVSRPLSALHRTRPVTGSRSLIWDTGSLAAGPRPRGEPACRPRPGEGRGSQAPSAVSERGWVAAECTSGCHNAWRRWRALLPPAGGYLLSWTFHHCTLPLGLLSSLIRQTLCLVLKALGLTHHPVKSSFLV